jgi:hypothetical protein
LADFLPNTEEGIYFSMALLVAAYMGLTATLQVRASGFRRFERFFFQRVFDSITFCTSLSLLAGLMNPPTMTALGNIKPFLFTAAILGISYSVVVIRPK